MGVVNKTAPELRFPEFDGDWQRKPLSEVVSLVSGFAFKSEYFGEKGVRLITPKNFTKHGRASFTEGNTKWTTEKASKKFICVEGDLLLLLTDLTPTCELLGKPAVLSEGDTPCLLNQRIAKVEVLNGEIETSFLSNLFLSDSFTRRIKETATGSTVRHSSNKIVLGFAGGFPTLPEQRKIASFLTTVDGRIGQLIQKKALLEDYKKGVMQQLFTQAIRFKDDHGNDFPDWEDVEIGEVLGYEQPTKYIVNSTEYSDEYPTPVLTAGKTFILGYTNEEDGICDTGLPLIIFDDFTTAYKFVDFPFKVKSSAMKILRAMDEKWDVRFIHNAMSTIRFPKGEHKRYWIGEYQFMSIPAPSPEEQTKIANFLSAIDRKIESIATQITETQTFKKGLLQQMFV